MPSRPIVLPRDTLRRLQQGDDDAFERVFRTYYAPLGAFAFRFVRDAARAEDVVQDVFATLWSSRHSLVVKTSVRAYLYAAVRNRALNVLKHEDVVEAWEIDESDDDARRLYTTPPQPDAILDARLINSELSAAFAALPERQAEVMRLRWRDELSYAEIAEALGISVKGVEKHLARGLAALRSRLT